VGKNSDSPFTKILKDHRKQLNNSISMLKKLFFVVGIIGLYLSMVSLKKQTPVTDQQQEPVTKKNAVRTLIIDPGHGGIDPGCHGLFSKEKDVALQISLKLGKAIQEEYPEMKIIFTRTTDILPGNFNNIGQSLRYRAELANKSKADLFLCIHCDAVRTPGGWYEKRIIGHKPKTVYVGKGKHRKKKVVNEPIYESYYVENKVNGPSTYIWAADRSDIKSNNIDMGDDEGGENIEDSLNVLDLNSPEARIRAQLYTKYFFKNSYTIASYVQDEFKKAGRNDKGVLQRNNKGIWVLQATGMPSILVETGYLTNKEEEKYLNSEDGQNEVVSNIVSALKRYTGN
jgi:N-acetylmuramoyl-L-alanine amidase